MFNPKQVQELIKKFFDSLPEGLKGINHEMEAHIRQFLQYCFNEMNLITREEYDIQIQVLAKTRAKLENLEDRLNKMKHSL